MAGNQNRGLIRASITKGWDPTVIVDRATGRTESIANFDKDQGNLPRDPVGSIPGGPPSPTAPGPGFKEQDWSGPNPSGNEDRRTTNADPNPGMPGAGGSASSSRGRGATTGSGGESFGSRSGGGDGVTGGQPGIDGGNPDVEGPILP